jgi:hypothetical protein
VNTFHTITSCRAPCNLSTGDAYPVPNGRVTFDSGQLVLQLEDQRKEVVLLNHMLTGTLEVRGR